MTSRPNPPLDDSLDAKTLRPAGSNGPTVDESIPRLTILHHPDPGRVGEVAILGGLLAKEHVSLSRAEPQFAPLRSGSGAQALRDPFVSRSPIVLTREGTDVAVTVDQTSTTVVANAQVLVGKHRFTEPELNQGVVLELAGSVVLLLHTAPAAPPPGRDLGIVGESNAIQQLRRQIVNVAPHEVPVLILGESGTGKELVARAVHQNSGRRNQGFVSVNMGAIPETTAASSLFGHARGAFTGAHQASSGYFGEANRGTLFLDEIAESPPDVQAALLRALENGEVQPVGQQRPNKVDVRLVAATDADLESAVDEKRFRMPLLHRLRGFELKLPPLRARRDDIARLFFHFLREELQTVGRLDRLARPGAGEKSWVPAWLVTRLCLAPWPGNVRELRNVTRQIVISSSGLSEIPDDPAVIGQLRPRAPDENAPQSTRTERTSPQELTDEALVDALERHDWRPGPTATTLGISRTSLYALIEKSPSVRKAADLSQAEIETALAQNSQDTRSAARQLRVSERGLKLRLKDFQGS